MPTDAAPRPPLTRDRVLRAAVGLADRGGLRVLTMRRLGGELGVEAMSLYKHVSDKDDILDGILDLVIAEIELPQPGADWKEAMRQRAVSAREVFGRHPWAIGLLESQTSAGPATLRYIDAIIGSLRAGGFSVRMAIRAFWLLDSYVYGHVVQELSMPSAEDVDDGGMLGQLPAGDEYPHLVELAQVVVTTDFDVRDEFESGLDLVLDALDRLRITDH